MPRSFFHQSETTLSFSVARANSIHHAGDRLALLNLANNKRKRKQSIIAYLQLRVPLYCHFAQQLPQCHNCIFLIFKRLSSYVKLRCIISKRQAIWFRTPAITIHPFNMILSMSFICILMMCALVMATLAPWDLPPLPLKHGKVPSKDFNSKRIPQHLWLTFRALPSSRHEMKSHLRDLFAAHEKKGWTVHLNDDKLMDDFMEVNFRNTSLLWAYHMIHPRLGVARADIWRYAVLWFYGGVYIDDDSNIDTPLDDVSEQHCNCEVRDHTNNLSCLLL